MEAKKGVIPPSTTTLEKSTLKQRDQETRPDPQAEFPRSISQLWKLVPPQIGNFLLLRILRPPLKARSIRGGLIWRRGGPAGGLHGSGVYCRGRTPRCRLVKRPRPRGLLIKHIALRTRGAISVCVLLHFPLHNFRGGTPALDVQCLSNGVPCACAEDWTSGEDNGLSSGLSNCSMGSSMAFPMGPPQGMPMLSANRAFAMLKTVLTVCEPGIVSGGRLDIKAVVHQFNQITGTGRRDRPKGHKQV